MPTLARPRWGHSWTLHVLPYLEQTPLYDRTPSPWNDSGWWGGNDARSNALKVLARSFLPAFRCPSQDGPKNEPSNVNGLTGRGIGNYLGNAGGLPRNDNGDMLSTSSRANGVLTASRFYSGPDRRTREPHAFRDVKDGTSNTLLIAESVYLLDRGKGCNICDRYILYHMNFDSGNGSDFSEVLGSTYYKINNKGNNNSARECAYSSFHPGGCVGVLCDGSTRFVPETVDLAVWRAVGSRGGGESLSLD
ncbi:MAG: DUF1559 domain-containing protein [Pirellulaceae bacterium]|nr:DUF1559 domain-containing protein [Pirellulaceae bacterium]